MDTQALIAEIEALGHAVVRVRTAATVREVYLRRPDLGRKLDVESAERLHRMRLDRAQIAIVIADGLSSRAISANAVSLFKHLLPRIAEAELSVAPCFIAEGARVALGDDIGERIDARQVLVLIGERPGLSSPDSLGAYITYAPRVGRTDAERNCVSNIRTGGLGMEAASAKISWLIDMAFKLGASGVALKDESDGVPALNMQGGLDVKELSDSDLSRNGQA